MSSTTPLKVNKSVAMSKTVSSTSELVIVKQGNEEKKTVHNGRNVHTVVKNAPFVVVLSLSNTNPKAEPTNVGRLQFQTALVYDAENPPYNKEVDFVKVKPVEHKAKVSSQVSQVHLEIRLKVLTSQHENSLFRVKISATQQNGERFVPDLCVFTDAIKVMSKPEQIMKKAHQKKKRSLEDTMADTVTRILEQQKQQEKVIQQLLSVVVTEEGKKKQMQLDTMSLESLAVTSAPNPKKQKKVDPSFEDCFSNFLDAYQTLSPEERPRKIRRAMRSVSASETEKVAEFFDHLQTENVAAAMKMETHNFCSMEVPQPQNCCALQSEVETLDEYYKDFLTTPLFLDLMI